MLVLVGWPDPPPVPVAWKGATPNGAPICLAAASDGPARPTTMATSPSGRLRVLFTGSLYNRHELAAGLEPREDGGGRLAPAEVVLRLFEERGPRCFGALRGSFGLVIWDGRRGQLTLVRDPLGLAPLYLAAERGRLSASTSLPALLRLPGLAGSWDVAALDTLLALGTIPAPATIYPGIRQVCPGESIVWDGTRLRSQRYWQLTFPERRFVRADAAGLVRERVLEAFRLRRTGMKTGLLLSGGLAAATILQVAVSERRPPAVSCTVRLGAHDDAEVQAAIRLAARAQVAHNVAEATIAAGFESALAAHAEPSGVRLEGALLAAGFAAVAAGGAVALTGHGGEEVFGGVAAHRLWLACERYRRLPGPLKEMVQVWARLVPSSRMVQVLGGVSLAPVAFFTRGVTLFSPAERAELFTPDALALIGEHRGEEVLAGVFADAMSAGATDPLDALHYATFQLRLPSFTALGIDAAARGVDLRLPLADHRLAQIIASLPPERRGTANARQLVLQTAFEDLLPRAVARQAARPLQLPADAWNRGELRDLLEETLAPDRIASQGVLRPDAVARLRAEHAAGVRDHGTRLWTLMATIRWLEQAAHGPMAAVERAVG